MKEEPPFQREERLRRENEIDNKFFRAIEALKELISYSQPGAERTSIWEAIERVAIVQQHSSIRRQRDLDEKLRED